MTIYGPSLGSELFHAAKTGDAAAVQLALESGADVDFVGPLKRTPLHAAIADSQFHIVPLLIKAGAALEPRDQTRGATPLCLSTVFDSFETVEMLLAAGADPDAADESGMSPTLRAASQSGEDKPGRDDRSRSAIALARASLNRDLQDALTGNALHQAAKAGSAQAVAAMIQMGYQIEAKSRYGETPLFHSASHGNIEAARLLLTAGADPNFRVGKHTCMLAAATARRNAVETLEALEAAGADLGSTDWTSFDAETTAHPEAAAWLSGRRRALRERGEIEASAVLANDFDPPPLASIRI